MGGSIIVDKLGGYQGVTGVTRTLKICAIFATIAAMAALSTCFVPPSPSAFVTVVALICVTLFFGGCIIPSATGCLMEVAGDVAATNGGANGAIVGAVSPDGVSINP